MKAKNRIALILALMMLLSLLAGCAGDSASTTETPEATVPAATAPVQQTEDIPEETGVTYPLAGPTDTLSMWIAVPGFVLNNWDAEDLGSLPAYKAAQETTGITLDITAVSTQFQTEQFALMVNSGDLRDIMPGAGNDLYTGGSDGAVEQDILLEISDLVKDNAPDYYEAVLTNDAYIKLLTSDNGLMTDVFGPSIPEGNGMIVRQDWLDDLGLKTPVTYDDFYGVLTAFKTAYDVNQPILFLSSGLPGGDSLTSGFGVGAHASDMATGYHDSFYYEDGVMKFGLVEPGFKDYLTTVNKWYNEGLISVDFVVQDTSQVEVVKADIASGQVGIWWGSSDYFDATYINSYIDENYDPAPLADPVMNEGDTLHTGLRSLNRGKTAGSYMGVGANTQYPELVLQFLNYFFTEEGQTLANYGAEGVSYNIVGGEVQFTDLIAAPELPSFIAKMLYTSYGFPFVELENRYASLYTTEEQLTLKNVWNSNRDTLWLPNGKLNAEETDTFGTAFPDINTYCMESVLQFITGQRDIDAEFDAFVQECYGMGLQDCIDVKQAAEDRYSRK